MEIKDRKDAPDADDAEKVGAAMKIDPELIRKGGADAAPVIAGIHFYRQLDGRTQTKVLEGLAKLEETHPELAAALRERHADILVQPRWRPWSMSDPELKKASEDTKQIAGWLNDFSRVVSPASTLSAAPIPNFARPLGIGAAGAALTTFGMSRILEQESGQV